MRLGLYQFNVEPVDASKWTRLPTQLILLIRLGAMRRVQFIELHEQPWCPSSVRDGITDALQFGFNLLQAYAPIAPLLQGALDSSASGSIVDMCSGAGGPWSELSRRLRSRTPNGDSPGLQIWLTDKYPNPGAIQNIRASSGNHASCYPGSVDAMAVPVDLKGFRTMFTSFHHFPPEEARAILKNAVDAGEGIGIFEIPRRAPSTIGLTFAFILMLFVCTPWIRPFRWSRLLWTFVVPIVPFVLLFDGVVSCLRAYRPQEMREMVGKLAANDYVWEIGEHSSGKIPITYLIGYPRVVGPSCARLERPEAVPTPD
jgi:hypothetical protein